MEDIIFSIIPYGGDAKALAYEAIEASDLGDFDKAQSLLDEADESLKVAHNTQTEMLTEEVNGNNKEVSLLLVRAQDHLMTAIEVRSLAERFIAINKRISRLEEEK